MSIAIDGRTRLYVIVGDPIAQVKSPGGLSAALAAAGHNAVLVPVHVGAQALHGLIAGLSLAHNLDGIVATVPHKLACFGLCRETTARASFLEAVNVMRRRSDGSWFGDMTDGQGFVAAMRKAGCEPSGKRALLVGAGGAGSAIALSLLEAGARELAICEVDTERRSRLIERLGGHSGAPVVTGTQDPSGFDIVANATPLGMREGDPLPIDVSRLMPTTYVGCVVTAPAVPPLIAAARQRGCRTGTGTDMFLGQQQIILEFLTGSATAISSGPA